MTSRNDMTSAKVTSSIPGDWYDRGQCTDELA